MPEVSVRLKDIDETNWTDVVLLTTTDGPNPMVIEEYVASNALSICQAMYEGTWEVKAVYCGRKAIGFAMYGYSEEHDEYELLRLMIDHNHQNRGFGTMALGLCLDELFCIEDCDRVYLHVHRDNTRARRIYEEKGFISTGEMNGAEEEFCIERSRWADISK